MAKYNKEAIAQNVNTNKKENNMEIITVEGLEGRNVTALKRIAKDLGVKGYTKFKKGEEAELVKLIMASMETVATDEQLDTSTDVRLETHTEEEIETMATKLEKEAAEFRATKEGRSAAPAELFKETGGPEDLLNFSKARNPVVENGLKLYVAGLSPETIDVDGRIITPYYKDGKVSGVMYKKGKVSIAKNSPFAKWALEGKIKVMTIASTDADTKFYCYEYAALDAWKESGMLIYGNLKKTECVLGVAKLKTWKKLTGHNPQKESNPNKYIGTFMTPHSYKSVSTRNGENIKLLVLEKQFTEAGYPLNDGNMICAFSMFYERTAEGKKRDDIILKAAIEAEKAGVEFDASKVELPDPKYKRCNASFQFRSDPEFLIDGEPLHALKGKGYTHFQKFMRLCRKHNLTPFSVVDGKLVWHFNAIATKDLIKTRVDELNEGDIIEFPATALRIVGIKLSDGKSALGRQSIALHGDSVRQLLREYAVEKAKVVYKALEGNPEAFYNVLMADTEATFEDAPLMPAKVFGFMPSRDRIPMYESIFNVIMARIYTYCMEHVLKAKIFDYAAYVEVNEDLDKIEQAHFEEHGTWINVFNAPHCNKFLKANKEGVNWNIGRNPIVAGGNVQGFIFNEFNDTTDTIEISARALYTMFGDVDGDTVIIFPHKHISFPVYTRPAPAREEGKKKAKALIPEEKMCDAAIDAAMAVIQSAKDTGVLDNRRRQIITERWAAGRPCTPNEIMQMGNITEDAISGMKHHDAGAVIGAEDLIIKKFGVNGKSARPKNAPQEFRAISKHGGNSKAAGSPKECMLSLVRTWKKLDTTRYNPYDEVLAQLKDASTKIHHKDSQWMKQQLVNFWRDNIAKHHRRGFYPWTEGEVKMWALALTKGSDKVFDGEGITGHGNEARIINKKYGHMKRERRQAYADLNAKYCDYVRMITKHILVKYFKDLEDKEERQKWAMRFMRQLMIQVGIAGFFTGTRRDDMGMPGEMFSTGGSCFWCFPMKEGILWLSKQLDPENPYLERIEEAVEANIKKREEYILKQKEDEVGEHIMD